MTSMVQAHKFGSVLLSVLMLGNCASFDTPDNLEPVGTGDGYQAQYRAPTVSRSNAAFLRSADINGSKCKPQRGGANSKGGGLGAVALQGERVSRNDLINIRVGDDETFNGDYVVSRDGTIKLPFLSPIPAQGRKTSDIEDDVASQLLAGDYFSDRPPISVRVADFASVTVGVAGAVFEPHSIEIGGVPGDQVDSRRQSALGASSEGRNLSAALRAVGGVRPDADISAVELRRNGTLHILDMRGVFEGRNVADVMLLTGDEISVPSRECFQEDLMRPSPISPPGVSLFLSNLTQPAAGNAVSAVGRDVREVPYGSRYLQAVINTNCVGGARTSSADRSAVLFSRNPITGVSVVIERDIEDLLRRADRDDYDPYLLPGDAIACYDSAITNVGEIARVLGIIGLTAATF